MASITWTGHGGSNNWSDPSNWSAGGPPGASDLALFDTGINSTVAGNATVGGIDFLYAQDVGFTGAITVAGIAGLAESVVVGGNARIHFDGSASSLTAPTLDVGVAGGSSTLTMNGASLTTNRVVVGDNRISQGILSISNAFWSDANSLVIGRAGSGGVSIGPGGDVFVGRSRARGNVVIGAEKGANGSLDLNGGGNLMVYGNLAIGGPLGDPAHGVGQVNVGPNSVINASLITINAGSTVGLATGYFNAYNFDIAQGALIEGAGRIIANSQMQNDGEIRASGFLDLSASVTGTGSLEIGAGSELFLEQSVLGQASIAFLGTGATLGLAQFVGAAAPLTGFTIGDAIQAAYVDHVSWNPTTGILTLMTGTSVDGTLALTGDFTGDVFKVHYAGSVGTITVQATHHM